MCNRQHASPMTRMQTRMGAILILFCCLLLTTSSGIAEKDGISDVPNGCNCHNAVPHGSVIISLEGLPDAFNASETYMMNISVSGGAEQIEEPLNTAGFNVWVSRGTLSIVDGASDVQIENGEATHTEAGNDQRNWTVLWTAPPSDEVTTEFRITVNTVNGDDQPSTDDQWNRLFGEVPGINVGGGENTPGFTLPLIIATLVSAAIFLPMRQKDGAEDRI
jgi:hypothetical protein